MKACKRYCGQSAQAQKQQNGEEDLTPAVGCGFSQPRYLKDKLGIKIRWEEGKEDEEERKETNTTSFSAQDALEILKKISREDVIMLGLDPGHLYNFTK